MELCIYRLHVRYKVWQLILIKPVNKGTLTIIIEISRAHANYRYFNIPSGTNKVLDTEPKWVPSSNLVWVDSILHLHTLRTTFSVQNPFRCSCSQVNCVLNELLWPYRKILVRNVKHVLRTFKWTSINKARIPGNNLIWNRSIVLHRWILYSGLQHRVVWYNRCPLHHQGDYVRQWSDNGDSKKKPLRRRQTSTRPPDVATKNTKAIFILAWNVWIESYFNRNSSVEPTFEPSTFQFRQES